MEWLIWVTKQLEKQGIDKEVIEKFKEEAKDVKFIDESKFNEVSESKKQLENDIKDRDKQLKDLGSNVKDNEELSKQITQLQETNKKTTQEYEAKIKNMTIDSTIKTLLKDNNAKYDDLLISKFDRDSLKIENGKVIGIDEQFNSIKENYPDMFEATIQGHEPNSGNASSGNTSDGFLNAFK